LFGLPLCRGETYLSRVIAELEHAVRSIVGIVLALLLGALNAIAAELPDLRAARSLVAEAALILRLDAQHRLTATYAAQAQNMVDEQLQSKLKSLASESPEAELIRAALAALKARDLRRLEQAQQQLTRLVDMRE
jgi:hypothetical protein